MIEERLIALLRDAVRAAASDLGLDGDLPDPELQVPKKKPRQLGPGDSFGEISVLDGGPRTATVTAQTPVKAFRLGRDEFETVLDRHGSIGRKILVEMCARLRYAESRMRPA